VRDAQQAANNAMKRSAKAAGEYKRLGLQTLASGDVETASKALRVAAQGLPRDKDVRIALAHALRLKGDIAVAAVALTEALAIPPASVDAARALSSLLQRYNIDEPDDLKPAGLRAALGCATIDHQPIARTCLHFVCRAGVLAEPMAQSVADGWDAAAMTILDDRKAAAFRDELLRDALSAGFNTDARIEHLLAALRRRVMLDVPDADLLGRRDLFAFCLALVAQLHTNEHVWSVQPDEAAAVDRIAVDLEALGRGDAGAAGSLVKVLLYENVMSLPLAEWPEAAVARIRPKALAQVVGPLIAARQQERALANAIESFGGIEDVTSQRVAGQYEKSPYPRWTSINTGAPTVRLGEIERVFGGEIANRLRQAPFEVLVAGCGTGQHAAQIAVAYGANARILGVDLSRASLAYAQRMVRQYGLDQVTFAQADLVDASVIGRQFDIIECIGVLHHMADPLAGWRSVLGLLKPGGLMYVGLYSAVARRALAALRDDPQYPGPGCSDDAARAYRASLMARSGDVGNDELVLSQNFYTLSDFRDLVLHESEQHMTLEEIATFLDQEALAFTGFALDADTLSRYGRAFPDDPLPGRLENWAAFERDNPRTFEGMYCFWCRKND
jgi:SAM-dependent methyltransferase